MTIATFDRLNRRFLKAAAHGSSGRQRSAANCAVNATTEFNIIAVGYSGNISVYVIKSDKSL